MDSVAPITSALAVFEGIFKSRNIRTDMHTVVSGDERAEQEQ